jgi:hypothetical protein
MGLLANSLLGIWWLNPAVVLSLAVARDLRRASCRARRIVRVRGVLAATLMKPRACVQARPEDCGRRVAAWRGLVPIGCV